MGSFRRGQEIRCSGRLGVQEFRFRGANEEGLEICVQGLRESHSGDKRGLTGSGDLWLLVLAQRPAAGGYRHKRIRLSMFE